MNYKLETKEPFTVIGYHSHFPTVDKQENLTEIATKWAALTSDQMTTLFSLSDGHTTGLLGISNNQQLDYFNYSIGTTTSLTESNIDDLTIFSFPKADWVVFTCTGSLSHAMIDLKKSIISDRLPSPTFKRLPLPQIELYPQGDMTSDNYESQLLIPIKK